MKDIDRYRGCLIGGAVGDALGYVVEFLNDSDIFSHYVETPISTRSSISRTAATALSCSIPDCSYASAWSMI